MIALILAEHKSHKKKLFSIDSNQLNIHSKLLIKNRHKSLLFGY